MNIDKLIVVNLLKNEEYVRKTLPYLKEEFFSDRVEKTIFSGFSEFFKKYNELPSIHALKIAFGKKNFSDSEQEAVESILKEMSSTTEEKNLDWLIDETEKFCKEKALYNALLESIQISDSSDTEKTVEEIPDILKEALSVSFDDTIGHDFFEDIESRYNFYNTKESRIPFDMQIFNKITKGGLPAKTLSIIMAGTGVGKSLVMCHFAKSFMMSGKNVLYITMEMAEEWISQRIDANLLDTNISEIEFTPKETYVKKLQKIKETTNGRLFIKEYPTSSASVVHFQNLIDELKIKKSFKPDIIFIDYINICSSKKITKMYSGINSYTLIKSIAEEIRGMAVENNVPIVSATQTNREGFNSSDVDMTHISESFSLGASSDLLFALISTEELESLGQLMVKQLKNRFAGIPPELQRFNIGVDKNKMKIYELEDVAQDNTFQEILQPPASNNPDKKATQLRDLVF